MLSKSAKKVLDAANEAYSNLKECDEERAYVLYMKFIYVFDAIKKTKDYKDDRTYYNSMVSLDRSDTEINILSKQINLGRGSMGPLRYQSLIIL